MRHSEAARSLAQTIEDEITRCELKAGWRLPPEEELSEKHNVSRRVVRDAIASLRDRGRVTSRRGSGTFVASLVTESVNEALHTYVGRTAREKAFDELLQLRCLVEGECARELAFKGGKEAFCTFRRVLRR